MQLKTKKTIWTEELKSLAYRRFEPHEKALFWYAFFMAFPIPMLVFNVTIYIFPFVLYYFNKKYGYVFKYVSWIQIIAVFFAIAAIISSLYAYEGSRSLSVLPNYIYWSILIIFLVSHAQNLNFKVVFFAVFLGVIASTIYVYTGGMGLDRLPVMRRFSPNEMAFLVICYTPIAVYYLKISRGFTLAAIFTGISIVIAFLSGSRSGSLLVLTGGVGALFVERINFIKGIPFAIALFVAITVLENTGVLRDIIFDLNPRTYELIYQREEVLTTDRSYLTRQLMIEKGKIIFEQHPYTGIGLNNFTIYTVRFRGEFEGSVWVIGKDLDRTSAHNSYISILSEGGLFLFIPFLILLGRPLFILIRKIQTLSNFQKALFMGFAAMCVHLYFISAILNVFAWMMIAMGNALAVYKPNKTE